MELTSFKESSIPVDMVPTPTREYRKRRKFNIAVEAPAMPSRSLVEGEGQMRAVPETGSRVLIYKQDPSVAEIGIRKVYIPTAMADGPSDARIASAGLAVVAKNSFGDFIQTPGTDAFDAVQAFAVVRMALTSVQRALASVGENNPIPWPWNSINDMSPLTVHAHGLPDTMNAFYSRSTRSLRFGDFVKPGSSPAMRVFTCRSLDIVAHETGHAILDSLKPGWISSSTPQTGGLHESFGDLTAIFLTLSQMDQVEAVIAQTKGDLHDKTFLADMAEEFGLALGRPTGLRNADNDLRLSEAGSEVHAISQVFTGGIYDILADLFVQERDARTKDDARTLYDVGQYLYGLVLRALIGSPAANAAYAHVVNNMLRICAQDGKPAGYLNSIRNRFVLREVVVAPAGLMEDHEAGLELAPGVMDRPQAIGLRHTCCGTMKHDEYLSTSAAFNRQLEELKQYLSSGNGKRHGD